VRVRYLPLRSRTCVFACFLACVCPNMRVCVCVCVCVCACMLVRSTTLCARACARTHAYVRVGTCEPVHLYLCLHLCLRVRMCACVSECKAVSRAKMLTC